jgi:hypothetical protein
VKTDKNRKKQILRQARKKQERFIFIYFFLFLPVFLSSREA